MAKLSDDEIKAALSELPGWRYERGEIFKQYRFPTFMDAIAFIDRVADRAEGVDHHPDLENHYDRVRVGMVVDALGPVGEGHQDTSTRRGKWRRGPPVGSASLGPTR